MENQEQKFVCKNCSKTFTNCRRLGGHMRCHVTKKSKLRNFNKMGFNSFHEFDDSSYKLRENPKKTWRVSDSDRKQSTNLIKNRGLTSCHFKREKEECKRSRGSILCEDTQPGIEILCPIRKKRSKLRYRVSGFCSDIKFSKSNEFDKEEEAALGLMMLYSGFTKWVDFISDFNSSENDSLISKAKALHKDEMKLNSTVSCSEKNDYGFRGFEMKFSETVGVELRNKKDLGSNQDASKTKSGEFKKPVMGENFEIIFSDSEIENENELIGVELGSKNDFGSNQAFSEINSGYFNNFEINLFDSEMEKGSEAVRVELGNEKYLELNQAGNEINYGNFKKPVTGNDFEINFPHFVIEKESKCRANQEASFDGMKLADSISVISGKCEEKLEFNCKTCNKKFPSFQALGGHRAKKCDEKKFEMKISKNKYIHECPICFKIFQSGQALGGHKRAHFNFENKNESATDFSFVKNVHFREAMVG